MPESPYLDVFVQDELERRIAGLRARSPVHGGDYPSAYRAMQNLGLGVTGTRRSPRGAEARHMEGIQKATGFSDSGSLRRRIDYALDVIRPNVPTTPSAVADALHESGVTSRRLSGQFLWNAALLVPQMAFELNIRNSVFFDELFNLGGLVYPEADRRLLQVMDRVAGREDKPFFETSAQFLDRVEAEWNGRSAPGDVAFEELPVERTLQYLSICPNVWTLSGDYVVAPSRYGQESELDSRLHRMLAVAGPLPIRDATQKERLFGGVMRGQNTPAGWHPPHPEVLASYVAHHPGFVVNNGVVDTRERDTHMPKPGSAEESVVDALRKHGGQLSQSDLLAAAEAADFAPKTFRDILRTAPWATSGSTSFALLTGTNDGGAIDLDVELRM